MSHFAENRISDSGISMDDNNDRHSTGSSSSLTLSSPQCVYCNNVQCNCVPSQGQRSPKKMSYVQKMTARFETICLKQKEARPPLHSNWWLDDQNLKKLENSTESVTDSATTTTAQSSTSDTHTSNDNDNADGDSVGAASASDEEQMIENEERRDTKTDTDQVASDVDVDEIEDVVEDDGGGDDGVGEESETEFEHKTYREHDSDNGDDKIADSCIESEFGETGNHDNLKIPIETANVQLIARPLSVKCVPPEKEEDADSTYSDSYEGVELEEDSKTVEYEVEKATETKSRPSSQVSEVSQSSNKLSNIIRELVENEENYVRTLLKGIEHYVSSLDVPNLPLRLRGQKRFIFGNIERIYDFHANRFHPSLKACEEDVIKIAETFNNFIRKDYFYSYILFVLNRPRSQKICGENIEFFQERQNIVGDKLGINSFLLQPIQRLPRYQLLLNEIIKELGKNMDREDVKPMIAAVCRAEKAVQRLLDTVNESMSINDITEVYQINLMTQGKFRKMSEFDMFDHTLKRRYYGKVFLFDKCIIYTEDIGDDKLEYRGHYERDQFGMSGYDGKHKFVLFADKIGYKEVEFYAEINRLEEWYRSLHGMLKEVIEEEKQRLRERKTSNPSSPLRLSRATSVHSTRSSIKSWFSTSSGVSIASGRGRDSVSSADSYELGNSKWTSTDLIEKLKSTEKQYILMLFSNRKHYLAELPDYVIEQMGPFFKLFQTILNFHHYQFYPALKKTDTDMLAVTNVFKSGIQQNVFDIYNKYAMICGRVEAVLREHYKGNHKEENSGSSQCQPIDTFVVQPLTQITEYRKLFDVLIEKLRDRELFTPPAASGGDGASSSSSSTSTSSLMGDKTIELFQAAAFVQVELEKIERYVQENYKLYTIHRNRITDMDKCVGLVLSSDLVSTDGLEKFNHRLFLTEKSLVCVKLKLMADNEHYADVVFLRAYNKLDVRKSQSHKRCLKLYSKVMKPKKFVVHFQSNYRLNVFADRLVKCMEP